jgi:hypothetical protein
VEKKRITIKRLVWNDWNVPHIAKHNVLPVEVDEVCGGSRIEREGHRERIFLVGPTKAMRMLAIVLEPTEEDGVYKPMTAYDASKRNIDDYEKEMGR